MTLFSSLMHSYFCHFREAMRQKSTSPIAESGPYNSDSYLLPSPGAASTPNNKLTGSHLSTRDQYLTPMSVQEDRDQVNGMSQNNGQKTGMRHKLDLSPKSENKTGSPSNIQSKTGSPSKVRSRRLRSASCEDLSDYLRSVVYDPISKSMNDLLNDSEDSDYIGPEPFPRLQSFSGVVEQNHFQHAPENYYNIEGLKGKIYDGPGLPFAELRKRFSRKSLSRIRRSVSNPNFIGSLSLEKLNLARVNIGITTSSPKENRTSSLIDMLPDGLKKHISKDSSHRGSHSTLSSGAASKNSSRCSSAHASPYNSLTRANKSPKEDIVATTTVKGINITRRSRSFRRQKPIDHEHHYVKNHSNRPDHTSSLTKGENSGSENGDNSVTNVKHSEINKPTSSGNLNQTDVEFSSIQSNRSEDAESKKSKPVPKLAPKPKLTPAGNGKLTTEQSTAVTGV